MLLLFVTAASAFAAFMQIKSTGRTQRGVFLKDLYLLLRSDADIATAYYSIEYGQFVYENMFHGSPFEMKLDRLLTLLDLVCELFYARAISSSEIKIFEYSIARVYNNEHLRTYLMFLDKFYALNNISRKPFQSFQRYAMSLALRNDQCIS